MLFMKMAQAREARKDNKGFSLVELIIVIAIMVALVAMLAPQFVKYVQKSRDATVSDAAENVFSMVKSEAALNNIFVATSKTGKITVQCSGGNGPITITPDSNVVFQNEYAGTNGQAAFIADCGIDSAKKTKSDLVYTISIEATGEGSYLFSMSSNS